MYGERDKEVEKVCLSPFPSILLSPFSSQNAFDQRFRFFWVTFSNCFDLDWNLPYIFFFSTQRKDLYLRIPIFYLQVCFASCLSEYKDIKTVSHTTLAIPLGIFGFACSLWATKTAFSKKGPISCMACKGLWCLLVFSSQKACTKVPPCT